MTLSRTLPALAVALCMTNTAFAQTALDTIVEDTVSGHILPRVQAFADSSAKLAQLAESDCHPGSDDLKAGFHKASNDWVGISHLRFGPTETDDRAFAIAFWPDGRGKTPKALNALLSDAPDTLSDPEQFKETSIASRGLYALEFLLFDDELSTAGPEATHCTLVRAITHDIALNAAAIAQDWQSDYAEQLSDTGPDNRYRSDEEAAQELFKALSSGLEFTSEARLGRPLGTFDRPRPKRAELWRSDRSLRQVLLSLQANRELAEFLSEDDPVLSARITAEFDQAIERANDLDDPDFSGVSNPQSRFKIEALQQSVNDLRDLVSSELGPRLGVSAGFNSLDGD